GCITVCAEINPKAAQKRYEQGWVDELIVDLDQLVSRLKIAAAREETISLAYIGNVVEVWERFAKEDVFVHVGSDQTSLHIPWTGGYYPVGISYTDANAMMREDPAQFKKEVQS